MPSDAASPHDLIFAVMARPLGAFRSALASTIEQLRGSIEDAASSGSKPRGPDLGTFAAGRIDFGRFAAVASRENVAVEPGVADRMRRAHETLVGLQGRKADLFRARVAPGENLVAIVRNALAQIGRAFGAARAVDLSKRGAWQDGQHAPWLADFPFALWNGAERRLAPPLVVDVDGGDLDAEGLAAFLDGAQKIVLRVEGSAPPAALARLITPGVFVAQVKAPGDLEGFARWDGPGVAAIVPEGAALFVHDPAAGDTPAARLRVDFVPPAAPARPLGRFGAFQLAEPLRQLDALRAATGSGAGAGAPDATAAAPASPVDKLAAWLLSSANLEGQDA